VSQVAVQRYYNAGMGRYWSPDPTGGSTANPASINKYVYVQGDPVNFSDPSGTDPNCGPGMFWDGEGCTSSYVLNGSAGYAQAGAPCGSDWMTNAQESGPCQNPCSGDGSSSFGGESPLPPAPGCAAPEPPAGPAAPTPDCWIELEYRSAGITGVFGRTHASLVVHDAFGFTFTIQGEPHNYPLPPWGSLDISNTPGDIGNTQWGQTLTSNTDPNLCDQIDDIEAAEIYYASKEVSYNPRGPNSNSLIHWLLESGWVDQYFSAPPGSTGWNVSLYGHLF